MIELGLSFLSVAAVAWLASPRSLSSYVAATVLAVVVALTCAAKWGTTVGLTITLTLAMTCASVLVMLLAPRQRRARSLALVATALGFLLLSIGWRV